MRRIVFLLVPMFLALAGITSCVHEPGITVVAADGNFPQPIARIIVTKCAISGCHNAASYKNAAGLLLDSWEHMLNGSANGAAVIAYSPKYSPLLYFVNTDPALGTTATPTMPQSTTTYPQSPLSKVEYNTLASWIAAGAPDKNGNIPFAANPDTRQKLYLTNQGCDLVAVIDAQSRLVMRYIPVGTNAGQTESPHDIKVDRDGRYAYVSLYGGTYVQQIDTRTDTVIASANLASSALGGSGQWNILYLSPVSSSLMVSGLVANGYVVNVNTTSMQVNPSLTVDINTGGTDVFRNPHGLGSNATFDTFYTTLQYGNVVTKYWFTGGVLHYKYVSINGKPPVPTITATGSNPDPHQLTMAPGYDRYFVTCQSTNEVRIMDALTDVVLDSIPVGTYPQEMTLAPSKNYLFVTCTEDASNPLPGRSGSVYVIDYTPPAHIVKVLYGDFYQPHGVAVDEQNGLIYIPSRNANPLGPAPHHATACGGRAGWYSVYNLNTLEPADSKRYQVTVDPYTIVTRFK